MEILLIIFLVIFLIKSDMNGENGWGKIFETIIGIGVMVIAFVIGGSILMMIVSFIASL